ncbi:MAG: hypothetical protein IH589_00865 [Anaerolineales bacterium]|nr:hypothetical protein [Anaerolineales bacterium]
MILIFLFEAGISGCGKSPDDDPSKPVICTPQAPNVNIYREASVSVLLTPSVGAPNGASGVAAGLSAEQALALLQGTPIQGLPLAVPVDTTSSLWALVNETKNWSDVQTIKLDDSNEAQIVVTFISPQLIQAIFNSEVSRNGYAVSNPQPALDVVAAREELIFYVTVITTANNNINTTPHKILIPIQKMVIMNAEDVAAPPLHDDHVLAQPINSAFEPVYGYLTYPIAMIHANDCSWILDPVYNKKIIIIVPDIFVDNISVGPYTWVIPYSSLFKVGISSNSQTNMPIDPNLIASSLTPPSPMESLLIPNGLPENTFWQIYAGFLWKQVMLGIY